MLLGVVGSHCHCCVLIVFWVWGVVVGGYCGRLSLFLSVGSHWWLLWVVVVGGHRWLSLWCAGVSQGHRCHVLMVVVERKDAMSHVVTLASRLYSK